MAKPFVIGISGGSGAGKTTLARKIIQHFDEAQISYLNLDWFYLDRSHLPLEERKEVNYDHPDALDFELLLNCLKRLITRKSIIVPQYDFNLHVRSKEVLKITPSDTIVVDGILLFYSKQIRDLIDTKIFIDVLEKTRLERRIKRDILERGRTRQDVVDQFFATVAPMHETYVQPSIGYAEIVLNATDNFDETMLRNQLLDKV